MKKIIIQELNDTTRTFPRSLEEAFPLDYQNAFAVTRFVSYPSKISELIFIALVFTAGYVIGMLSCMVE